MKIQGKSRLIARLLINLAKRVEFLWYPCERIYEKKLTEFANRFRRKARIFFFKQFSAVSDVKLYGLQNSI